MLLMVRCTFLGAALRASGARSEETACDDCWRVAALGQVRGDERRGVRARRAQQQLARPHPDLQQTGRFPPSPPPPPSLPCFSLISNPLSVCLSVCPPLNPPATLSPSLCLCPSLPLYR
eukprot:2235348-Rhodomonas_salina.2